VRLLLDDPARLPLLPDDGIELGGAFDMDRVTCAQMSPVYGDISVVECRSACCLESCFRALISVL